MSMQIKNSYVEEYLCGQKSSAIHEGQLSVEYGFLPHTPIPSKLPSEFQVWEDQAKLLPSLLANFKVRQSLDQMPLCDVSKLEDKYLSRSAVILGAFAHSYYFNNNDTQKLPASILAPWTVVCGRLSRTSVARNNFDAFFCNWKLKDAYEGKIQNASVCDFELLIPVFNSQEERIFNLTIFMAELRFAKAFQSILNIINGLYTQSDDLIIAGLRHVAEVLNKITEELGYINPNKYSATYVDPNVWSKTVARFDAAVLPDTVGTSGVESPMFHLLDILLERTSYGTLLGKDMQSKKSRLAPNHSGFLEAVEHDLTRYSLRKHVAKSDNPVLKCAYRNFCASYTGESGWMNRHKMKVYGYIKVSFESGRASTNGGHKGEILSASDVTKVLMAKFDDANGERLNHQIPHWTVGEIITNNSMGKANEIIIKANTFDFQPGDKVKIYPRNNVNTAEIITAYHLNSEFKLGELGQDWQFLFGLDGNDFTTVSTETVLSYADPASMPHADVVDLLNTIKPFEPRIYSVAPLLKGSGNYQNCFRLTIGKCGVCSNYLINSKIGDTIIIKREVAMHFKLPSSADIPIIMFANGTGIASFVGFIDAHLQNSNANCYLYYAVKDRRQYYYKDELEKLSNIYPDRFFLCKISLSLDAPNSIDGLGACERNKIYRLITQSQAFVYVSGSEGIAKCVFNCLASNGVPTKLLYQLKADKRYMESVFTPDDSNKSNEYALSEVAKHDKKNDCWIVLNSRVYDISDIIRCHEGGAKILMSVAATDATEDFNNVNHNTDKQILTKLMSLAIGNLRGCSNPEYSSWKQILFVTQKAKNSLYNSFHHKTCSNSICLMKHTFEAFMTQFPDAQLQNCVVNVFDLYINAENGREVLLTFYKDILNDAMRLLENRKDLVIEVLKSLEDFVDKRPWNRELVYQKLQQQVGSFKQSVLRRCEEYLRCSFFKIGVNTMKLSKEVCVVVNAYSTGRLIAHALKALDYSCIHVQSRVEFPKEEMIGFDPSQFIDHLVYDGNNLTTILEKLRHYTIRLVVPGQEDGVELADILSNIFTPQLSNGLEFSAARRDKFKMVETIQANNRSITTVKHHQSTDPASIVKWADENKLRPVVLKPLASAGTEGFHLCHSDAEILTAFSNIYNKKNIFGMLNESVLAQSYLEGQEYNVNMINCNGQCYVIEIWKVTKVSQDKSRVFDLTSLVSPDDQHYQMLSDYAISVNNALGIKHGGSHCEIILTKNGPVLVEIAARLMGAIDMSFALKATANNAVLLMLDSYFRPQLFTSYMQQGPKKTCEAYMINLISSQAGVFQGYNTELIRSLPTFHSFKLSLNVGDKIDVTRDLNTCPGLVFLLSSDIAQIQADYNLLRQYEKEGKLYKVIEPLMIASTSPHAFFNDQPKCPFQSKSSVHQEIANRN